MPGKLIDISWFSLYFFRMVYCYTMVVYFYLTAWPHLDALRLKIVSLLIRRLIASHLIYSKWILIFRTTSIRPGSIDGNILQHSWWESSSISSHIESAVFACHFAVFISSLGKWTAWLAQVQMFGVSGFDQSNCQATWVRHRAVSVWFCKSIVLFVYQ